MRRFTGYTSKLGGANVDHGHTNDIINALQTREMRMKRWVVEVSTADEHAARLAAGKELVEAAEDAARALRGGSLIAPLLGAIARWKALP